MLKLKTIIASKLISWGSDFVLNRVYEYIITLILQRLRDYGSDIDWSLVRRDVYNRIRNTVPSMLLEEVVISIAAVLLKRIEKAFDRALNCHELQALLVQGKFREVAKKIKEHLVWSV